MGKTCNRETREENPAKMFRKFHKFQFEIKWWIIDWLLINDWIEFENAIAQFLYYLKQTFSLENWFALFSLARAIYIQIKFSKYLFWGN